MSRKTTTILTLEVRIEQPKGKTVAWTVEEIRRLLYNAVSLTPDLGVTAKLTTKEIRYD